MMRPRKILTKFFLCSLCLLLGLSFFISILKPVEAAAGIYRTINFQGKLVNKTAGTNITDGSYSFTFKFYDAASAGTQLPSGSPWSETQTLTVTNGIFRATLGSSTSIPTALDFNSDSLFLDITFNSETFTTRVRMSAVPYAFNAEKVSGLTVTNTTGTFTLANSKTLTVNNTLTLSGTDSTSFTFPSTSGGTVITSNAPTQSITSTQTSGTMLALTDSTALTGAIVGQSITLSGTGAQDQTGLQFNLSNATGTNLNDIVGTASTWKISKAGALTVASCSGCGAGGAVAWSAITNPSGNLSLTMGANTTLLTYNATTGSNNLFKLIDTASNSGTGYIMDIETASSSNAKPLTVVARGTTLIDTTAAGSLSLTAASGQGLTLTGNAASTWSVGSANALTLTSSTIQVSSAGVLSLPGAQATDITSITAGNALTIQPSTLATASGTGGALTLKGGTESGTTSTGGNVVIDAGTGTTTNGSILIGASVNGTITIGNTTGAKTIGIGIGAGPDTINIATGGSNADTVTIGNTSVATTLAFNSGVSTTTGVTFTENSLTTGTGLLLTSSGTIQGAGVLEQLTANSATTGTLLSLSSTGLTTGFNESNTMGTALTTGGALNVTGASYTHATGANETGNLVKLALTETTQTASGSTSTTNGLDIASTINIAGSGTGTRETSAIRVEAPTFSSCAAGTCNWNGLRIDSTTATIANVTETGLNIQAPTTIPSSGTYNSIFFGTSTGATANTIDQATISVGNIASTATQNRTTLNIQNAGTGFFDMELVRGMINSQQTNYFDEEFTEKALDTTNRMTSVATGTTGLICGIGLGVVNGVYRMTTGTVANNRCDLATLASMSNGFYQRGKNPIYEANVRPSSATNGGQRMAFGFSAALLGAADTLTSNHAYILKRAADTTWQCSTSDGTTESVISTGVAIDTAAFHRLRVTIQGGTTPQVVCSVDSTAVAKTTNIPLAATAMDIYAKGETVDTTSENIDVDYVRSWQDDPPLTAVGDAPALQTADGSSSSQLIAEVATPAPPLVLNTKNESQIVIKGQNGDNAVIFDNQGNATLSGTLIADTIKAKRIEGLEMVTDKITSLSEKVNTLSREQSSSSSAEAPFTAKDIGNVNIQGAQVNLDLTVVGQLIAQGAININGNAAFNGETIFNKIATFVSNVVFNGTISFNKVPTFNNDTAGFALIKRGEQYVDVNFDQEYAQNPVVAATLDFPQLTQDDFQSHVVNGDCALSMSLTECQNILESHLFKDNIHYVVAQRSTKGFVMLLDKPASNDINFSWVALAIKDAKKSTRTQTLPININAQEQNQLTPVVSPSPSPTPTPTQISTPSPSPSPTSSPTPTITPSPTVSPTP